MVNLSRVRKTIKKKTFHTLFATASGRTPICTRVHHRVMIRVIIPPPGDTANLSYLLISDVFGCVK